MSESRTRVVVAGGGAAGYFAAIACAEAAPGFDVRILEKGPHPLSKVRISGGGRCNVTHACFEPRTLSTRYPRGERALIGPFSRFAPADTIAWFAARGVPLKTEADGRLFPTTDQSATIIDCLEGAAKAARVQVVVRCTVERAARRPGGGFELTLDGGATLDCDRLLLATGGCRTTALGQLAVDLGHTLEPPVPSLFTFHVALPWLRTLPGIAVEDVEASVPGTPLCERGPLLITHEGVSGPVVLRLSAWGARLLAEKHYAFSLTVNWLPGREPAQVAAELAARRASHGAKLVVNLPLAPLPARLWEQLVRAAGVAPDARWSGLPRAAAEALTAVLTRCALPVSGKTLNQEEFVTCGGVRLREVDFKTMESKLCPGLYFAGELLDIDGITGGFNFQAAWTTGWIAGHALAGVEPRRPGGGATLTSARV
ncbi:MAG: NAD(P)/FAD-dependent oxidoreductase [Planctomycetes bacterium]|nr:NAD(P)/FAD-dependent oxidoreductase [Planctomycetota bacterium]